jgi:hypothetical protein
MAGYLLDPNKVEGKHGSRGVQKTTANFTFGF